MQVLEHFHQRNLYVQQDETSSSFTLYHQHGRFWKLAWRGLWSDSTVIFFLSGDMYWLNLWQANMDCKTHFLYWSISSLHRWECFWCKSYWLAILKKESTQPSFACITLKGDFCIAVIHVVLKANYITPLVCEMLEEYKRKKRGWPEKKMLKRANLPKKMHKYIHVGKCNRWSLVSLNISNVIGLAC